MNGARGSLTGSKSFFIAIGWYGWGTLLLRRLSTFEASQGKTIKLVEIIINVHDECTAILNSQKLIKIE